MFTLYVTVLTSFQETHTHTERERERERVESSVSDPAVLYESHLDLRLALRKKIG